MEERQPPGDSRRFTRWAWLLIVTVPVACWLSVYLLVGITLGWCGISGCSGGGYGLTSDPDEFFSLTCAAIAAALWFAALAGPPWIRPPRRRLLVAGVAAVGLATLMLVSGTGGFVRA